MADLFVRLNTLGRVSCTKDDRELAPLTAQPRRLMLLIYLALAEPRGFQPRDRLLALFWPEHDERRARNALSQAVHFLRRSLTPALLLNGADDQLRFDADAASCDAGAFEAALTVGRLQDALALYRGPFLDGFHITAAAPELDEWVAARRDRLGRLYERALRMMAQQHEDAFDFARAAVWHRKLVDADPLSSHAMLGLMRALVTAGDPEKALRHARIHETRVREELDASPDPEIASLVQLIRNGSPPAVADRPKTKAIVRFALSNASLRRTSDRARPASLPRAYWQQKQLCRRLRSTMLPKLPLSGHPDQAADRLDPSHSATHPRDSTGPRAAPAATWRRASSVP